MNKYLVKELIDLCKKKSIKGYSKKKKNELIKMINDIDKKDKDENDMYTQEILRNQYKLHKEYIISRKTIKNIRLPYFPEDISENMIKFINHKNGDKTSTWNCDKGDLKSKEYGKQECKCFTSSGPISFSPSSQWDELLFLDARDWFTMDKFVLYRFRYKRDSNEWKSIKVNQKETIEDQSKQGRRPRIGWKDLYPQIKNYCEILYEGSFDFIFK